ncbi:hypothetical protein E2C01_057627 [Portunus trituberculatus]|uniref:Uncharacterized protein n=1 Tax=Portunus trituberculatus TaxID=210409 RepID=A0A5B7H0V2_PORTR|nr:hypothetical protein [Portunus trituberculatus]
MSVLFQVIPHGLLKLLNVIPPHKIPTTANSLKNIPHSLASSILKALGSASYIIKFPAVNIHQQVFLAAEVIGLCSKRTGRI